MPPRSSRSESGETNRTSYNGISSFLALSCLLIASLVSVFLAGGPKQLGMGIFLLTAGLILVFISPSARTSWVLWFLGTLLVGSVSIALLPSSLLGLPEWSANLRSIPGLVLPECIAADPEAAGFWVAVLALGVFIALYTLASPLRSGQMASIALLAVLGCSLYAVMAWGVWQAGWNYPFYEKPSFAQAAFGFFPNRNHTAGFLLTGVILSLGLIHHSMRRGRLLHASLAAGCFALLTSVLLLFSVSRGGLVFLVIGVVVWVMGLGRYRSGALMMGGVALFAVVILFFLSSGSGLLERLKGVSPDGTRSVSAATAATHGDARIGIARDTFSIIADHPFTGTGLGSYPLVYPFYADKSLRDRSTALHAESDWLTLCSEGGIPALLIALAVLGFLLKGIPGLKNLSGKNWPLRWAFLSAFLAELLHGLVDVPLHKPELGWWVLLLGGIGFGDRIAAESQPGLAWRLQRFLFILGGISAISAGSLLIAAQWGRGWVVMPPHAVSHIQKRVLTLFGDGTDPSSVKAAAEELRSAISRHPMSQQLYYQLAVLLIAIEKNLDQAKILFTAQQAISPIDPDLPLEQGRTTALLDPLTTATYWNEALRRQLLLDRLPNSPVSRTGELYSAMIRASDGNRVLFYKLQDLGDASPELRLMWLGNSAADPVTLPIAANDKAFMDSLTAQQQGRLFQLWWQRGDKAAVAAYLDFHPEYSAAAIATRASILDSSGRQEQACRLLCDTFRIPMPSPKGNGDLIQSAEGRVPEDPVSAATYYMERGNDVAARRLLTEAMKREERDRQNGIRLQLAQLEMRSGNWGAALRTLLDYLRVRGDI